MLKMAKKEWEKFAVGLPSTVKGKIENTCRPLKTVSHVAHVPTAVRIVEDNELRAGLVFDKSKLNTERIRVVWLSPNDWTNAGGFRYGNIRFTYDWARLIDGKQFYWVESMAYGIEACRILVSDKDHSKKLDLYDPRRGDGPWYIDSKNKHYWNGTFCLEIMLETDIPLADAQKTDFVLHSENKCNNDYKTCIYRGMTAAKGGGEFLASLISRNVSRLPPGLTRKENGKLVLLPSVEAAAAALLQICVRFKPDSWGSVVATDPSALAIARGLLGTVRERKIHGDGTQLASLFRNATELQSAVKTVLQWALEPEAGDIAIDP